jgi:hypothetical protein
MNKAEKIYLRHKRSQSKPIPKLSDINLDDIWNIYNKISLITRLKTIFNTNVYISKISVKDENIVIPNVQLHLISPFKKTQINSWPNRIMGYGGKETHIIEYETFVFVSTLDILNHNKFKEIIRPKLEKVEWKETIIW